MISLLKKKSRTKGLTSLVFTEGGVAVAHITDGKSQPELLTCKYFPTSKSYSDLPALREYISQHQLENCRTVVVLPASEYQLLLVERPDVPENEIKEALRWRIKDLISFDVEQASIDYIDLPEDAYRGRSQMLYVIVAQKASVDKLVKWCKTHELVPIAVDVPELALLNLTEDLADSEAGLAVFSIDQQGSSINLLSSGALYFSRHVSYHLSSTEVGSESSAVLELQRSLDYYESQVGKPPCVRLLVMPVQPDDSALLNELRQSLPLDVHSLDLDRLLLSKVELTPELQQYTTVAIAAALRTDLGRGDSVQ
ncbi:hypothetical protein [uncultured Neptuniibacter sp.]|uniref:hypothetical protein n=1 Tax=uncultured Neptuniibacter sp. TaxID=502143 RepID=UPI0026253354|nr:hypothetical protein [uncultured Neptuniibacter sp.]